VETFAKGRIACAITAAFLAAHKAEASNQRRNSSTLLATLSHVVAGFDQTLLRGMWYDSWQTASEV
jgi:hypothetical protein